MFFSVYGKGKDKKYLCRIKGKYDWGNKSCGPIDFYSEKDAVKYGQHAPTTTEEMKASIYAEPE